VHNYTAPPTIPPSYIRVRAVVWECGEGQTDTQVGVTNIHFTSAMPHVKCSELKLPVFRAVEGRWFHMTVAKTLKELQ